MTRPTRSPQAALFASLPPALQGRNRQLVDGRGVLDVQRMAGVGARDREELARHLAEKVERTRRATEAQAVGQCLEDWLEDQHQAAVAMGIVARVRHVGPPFKHFRQGWKPVGVGPADYQGQLPDGTSLAVEAKSRNERLRLAEIPSHQRQDLDACAAAFGLAVLVYEFREGGRVWRFACRWTQTPWNRRRGEGSIGPDEMAPWEVPAAGCYLARFAGGAR